MERPHFRRYHQQSTLKQAGLEFLATLDPIAEALNASFQVESFTGALEDARLRLDGACPLLSEEIEQAALVEGHLAFGLAQAHQHHENWNTVTLSKEQLTLMKKEATDSLLAEQVMAASNEDTFDAFVDAYVRQP